MRSKTEVAGRAAIGFTVKSGWASVVLVTGPTTPRVVDCRTIDLSDPAIPESRQPYHAGFGTARSVGADLARLVDSVKKFGGQSAGAVIREYVTAGHDVRGVGIVVGSLHDPQQIANDHIRIHALEGQLFRRVVEDAATRRKLATSIWRERDLYGQAVTQLRQSEEQLRSVVAAFGREVAGAWRAEQKAATLAAWLVLAGPAPANRRRPASRA